MDEFNVPTGEDLQPEINEDPKDRQIQELQDSLKNVVNELKEERKKRQEVEATSKPVEKMDDVDAKVAQALAKQKALEAEDNRKKALELFVSEHKEFHPENDPAGLKMAALERELANFRTDGLYKVEDFSSLLKRATRLLAPSRDVEVEKVQPSADIPTPSSAPKSNTASKLTASEQDLIKGLGWTEERYLKLKESNPDYVASLF